MKSITEKITAIEKGIAGWRRVTGATPVGLARYVNVLYRIKAWERKAALAKTKLAIYRKRARYYQKKTGV